MFSESEISFLAGELKRFTMKGKERLESDSVSDTQRQRLETKLVTVSSIRRKLRNEQRLHENASKTTPSVLLVDDMESVLQLHKQILRKMGFINVETAANGQIALKKLKEAEQYEQPFGLVIFDWEMPKMSGFELLKTVRGDEKLWSVPFYLLTSRDSKKDMFEAINLGVTGYIVKPVSPASLEEKFKEYVFD
jgi:two-component system, chemotaxis family, chemotaxis protein CheY